MTALENCKALNYETKPISNKYMKNQLLCLWKTSLLTHRNPPRPGCPGPQPPSPKMARRRHQPRGKFANHPHDCQIRAQNEPTGAWQAPSEGLEHSPLDNAHTTRASSPGQHAITELSRDRQEAVPGIFHRLSQERLCSRRSQFGYTGPDALTGPATSSGLPRRR
jgi:hypothetical protein